ncbi:MAG: hypothetical protein AAF696_04185 [Bacteroidota bacterium]
MKKNKFLIYCSAILLSFSFAFQACTPEEVKVHTPKAQYLIEYEQNLSEIFQIVDREMKRTPKGTKLQVKSLFEKAVNQITNDTQDHNTFKEAFTHAASFGSNQISKVELNTELQELISTYETYDEAIKDMTYRAEFTSEEDPQKIFYIAMTDVLVLLNNHRDLVIEFIAGERKNLLLMKCSWWKKVGKCAAGIIGGALTGTIGGCVAGASVGAKLGLVGGPQGSVAAGAGLCVAVGVAGGIAGGFTGAAASCDGCDE